MHPLAPEPIIPEPIVPEPVAAILLAAGTSSRLGRPKQLVLYGGEPLIRRAAYLALAVGAHPVYAVVNDPSPAYREALADLPVTLLENPDAPEGMGSSLRVGMAALRMQAPAAARVLLLVCDQPLLRPEHIHALLAAPGPVVAASYSGRLGVPAVFSRAHFPALAAVQGDQGARALLRSLPVTAVPIPEAVLDIDTEDDLRTLLSGPQSKP